MSLLRDICDVILTQRQDCQRFLRPFYPQEYTVIMTPETYRRLLTEDWTPEERHVVSRVAPDQEVRILDVPVGLGEVPEDWGWMLHWRKGGAVPQEPTP